MSDGGGLLLRCSGTQRSLGFPVHKPDRQAPRDGLGACARHNAKAAGESLALARDLAAKQRALLAADPPLDPIDERNKAAAASREAERKRKAEKQQGKATLARVARAYHEKLIEPRMPAKLSADWIKSLENHVPPALWHKPIAEITRPELLEFLRDIQDRMADTAQRVRRRLDEVFEEAVEQGPLASTWSRCCTRSCAGSTSRSGSRRMRRSLSLPRRLSWKGYARSRASPRAAWNSRSTRRRAPGRASARSGRRSTARVWTVPGERMKAGEPHTVHLSERALAILAEMRALGSPFVFPSIMDKTRPLSNMAMLVLLKRMKRGDITVHGFRASFSTWANETAAARPDVIEACLAHREGDKIRAAYNRAQFAAERRKLLDAWAAFLEGREAASNVIELTSAKAA